ncbi:hypothetical protein Pcinc_014533 [Petrolisthes cinctipes]|uniref:Uncharacterized protein n=1 Tax=Petrolisthes cinctipes TaxID=88211 RepID=A0AAE1FW69_PETCI|nr:hypothetical protein Pcinc_014533 [Petrolisthes cinctipes]
MTQERETSQTDNAQEETINVAREASEDLREEQEEQPTIKCKISGAKMGLQIITTESRGWPKSEFDIDGLVDGLQRRHYSWTYTSKEMEEDEVFQKLFRNEIDLQNCWTKVQDSILSKIRSGHRKERSPIQICDPKRRRGSYHNKSEVEDANHG